MKEEFSSDGLPNNGLFFVCSSHEERCLGIVRQFAGWQPERAVVFHYDDPNPRRERNHNEMLSFLGAAQATEEIPFTEKDAVGSFRRNREQLGNILRNHSDAPVVADVSVFTKRHLLMLLRWLDDQDCWSRLWLLYSEPEEYEIESRLALSFGISTVEHVPGFSASPDPSRPLHVAMFLGYEGDRAFATHAFLQPRRTTLIIPYPPFRPEWKGRTEELNHNLLAVVGHQALAKADALDPESSFRILDAVFGPLEERGDTSRAICPLGTKPQIVGAYLYLRSSIDPPAVIYAGSLRHNHSFYSRGVGRSWIIHRPT